MLRSKQLLPFAKGARAWLVAGSVKPNVLDGTEDGRPDQTYRSTKSSHSTAHALRVQKVEDNQQRRGTAVTGATSLEKIREGPTNGYIQGPSLAQRSVISTGPAPSKENNSGDVVVSATRVENSFVAKTASASSGHVDGQAVNNRGGSVPTVDSTSHKATQVVEKAREVGLATVRSLCDQEHGRISKVNVLGADLTSGGTRRNVNLQNGATAEKAVPVKHHAGSHKIIQSNKSAVVSSISVEAKSVASNGRSTLSEGLSRKNGEYKTKEEPARNQKESFSTIDAPRGSGFTAKGNRAEAALNDLKPPGRSQQQVAKHTRASSRHTSAEVSGSAKRGGQDVIRQKNVLFTKSREANTGASGDRRKSAASSQAQAGVRQAHWSARDSGGEGSTQDMVVQVGHILRKMGWTSQTVTALSSFNTKLSPFHINEVLKHQKEPTLAWQFFNWAKRQNGYRHDVRTYTTMIGILGRARNFEGCNGLMEDMRREGCAPSVVTFNRLIHSYGRANYLGEALKLFHDMQNIGCEPDRVTYCTLIDLHSKAGFHDVALDICQKMWQAGFEADTFSYTLIIHCLGKAGNLPAAYKLFLEMLERGCTPNLVTFNIMIDLHAKAGKHHMALKLYNDMQDAGYRPDNVTYSVIMEVLGHSGHMEEAENVFNEMEQAGWTADATAYGSLVNMWGQTGNVRKATEWYQRMLDSGLLPNVPICNSLLWSYVRVNDHEAAGQVLDSMYRWGLTPTLPTYTLLLSSCTTCQNQQHVDAMLRIMSKTGHPAHNFLCSLLNEVDPWESRACVHRFFDSVHGEQQDIKRSFADALIEFLYKLDHKDRAGIVWEVAVEKNFYPSAISQRGPNYWIVDLHVMSMGTAVVALLRTLSSFRERMLNTGVVPDRIEIVTGWGKHSRVSGFSKIKNVVENILGALHAPFYVDDSNVGCFVGSGQPLVEWLHQSDMGNMLTPSS